MPFVKSLDDARPPARFETPPVPWAKALFQEAPDSSGSPGAWTTRSAVTIATGAALPSGSGGITPLGADTTPASPLARDLTTNAAAIETGGWYRVLWEDAAGSQAPGPAVRDSGAPGSAYVSLDELKGTLELSGESFADDDLALALRAASRTIDRHTGQRFFLGAPEQRFYSARSPSFLICDSLAILSALEVDRDGDGMFTETFALNTDFVLGPRNAAAEGRPWTWADATAGAFPTRERGVRITGQFGWAATPAEVRQATAILAAKLTRRAREAPFGVVGGFDGGDAARIARSDPDVIKLLEPLTHIVVA